MGGRLGQRGAAVTELAISLLLLLPLLVGLTFVGEVFSVGAKVQEAEIEGDWEVSAYQLHDFVGNGQGSFGLYQSAAAQVINRMQADLYYGLNSFDGSASGMIGRQLPFLTISPITLDCGAYQPPAVGITAEPSFVPLLPYDSLASYFNNGNPNNDFYKNGVPANQYLHSVAGASGVNKPVNYVSCQGHVTVVQNLNGFDADLHRWTNQSGLMANVAGSFSFCGSGATVRGCEQSNNQPQGGIVVLTDDWGLEDGSSNSLGSSQNGSFFNVGQAIYGGGTGEQKVDSVLHFLLDANLNDQGATNSFKAGFLNTQQDRNPMWNDVGSGPGLIWSHLTPYQVQSGGPMDVYLQRANGNYLGSPNPNFEDAP